MSEFYKDAAGWWPLFSPPIHYVEEAADLLARLRERQVPEGSTLVEFGSGGGSLAFHLKPSFQLTLTDLSPAMLDVSRTVNPESEHVQGDMRTLRLNRQFDIVLVHDAVMYMTSPDDLRAALRTAAVHCRGGGVVVVLPDYVRETFEPSTDSGGEDGDDGRGLRYLEWRWDPDPVDHTYVVDYAFLLRERDGMSRCSTIVMSRDCSRAVSGWSGLRRRACQPKVRSTPGTATYSWRLRMAGDEGAWHLFVS
jgi:SAM-dependent methyltransferase